MTGGEGRLGRRRRVYRVCVARGRGVARGKAVFTASAVQSRCSRLASRVRARLALHWDAARLWYSTVYIQ